MAITTYNFNRHTSSAATEIFDGGGGFFNTKGASQLILAVKRFGQAAGATTMDAAWEWLFEPDNTWVPMVDEANTALTMAQWATGITDTVPRYFVLNNLVIPTGTLTNGGIVLGTTAGKLYKSWIPEKIRVKFTHGGTLQNDFAAMMMIHAF